MEQSRWLLFFLGNRIDELQEDSVWPSMILTAMAWSVSFLPEDGFTFELMKFDFPSFLIYFARLIIL